MMKIEKGNLQSKPRDELAHHRQIQKKCLVLYNSSTPLMKLQIGSVNLIIQTVCNIISIDITLKKSKGANFFTLVNFCQYSKPILMQVKQLPKRIYNNLMNSEFNNHFVIIINFMNTAKFHNRSLSHSKIKSTNRIINGQFSEPNQLSSSILQQTHEQHSFPKAKRFQSVSRESTPKMLLLSDTKTKRSTSFGFGIKLIKPLDLERRDKLNPAPGDYQLKTFQNTKSFTFGNKLTKIERQQVPGPGQYQYKLQSKTPQFSIYAKILEKQVLPKQSASFVTYNPKEALTLNQRFNKISFGIGDRPKQTFNEQIPGPGSYQCKSLFDLICERRKLKVST